MATIAETADAAATAATAYTMTAGDTFLGVLDPQTSDWVAVTLTAGQTYSFGAVGLGADATGLTDPLLILHDASGNTIALNDNSGPGHAAEFTLTAATTGTYYVEVASPTATAPGDYGLAFSLGTKPSFDAELGAAALYRPGVTWSGTPGTGATVTWGVRSEGLALDASGHAAPFLLLTAAQTAAAQTALANYADICNLTVVQLNPGGTSNDATIELGAYQSTRDGAGAYTYYPANPAAHSNSGDMWLNDQYVEGQSLPYGSYSYFVFLHELGHAMGLAHPGDYNAAPGVRITYDTSAQFVQDSEQYTVMSYFHASATDPGAPRVYAQTLMMYDIYALQQMYGVNAATRAGDDTYGFHATVGGPYDFATNTTPLLCIWDGAGTDTLDLSGFARKQTIDLRAGHFSDVGGYSANLSIAIGAVIEDAVGGSKADDIFGNRAANVILGGAGADRLAGRHGNDSLTGGGGPDSFVFAHGTGHDTVTDFSLAHDHLVLNDNLWGGVAMTAAEVVAVFASVVGSGVVLTFGANTITLAGLTATAGLDGQILLT